MENLRRGECRHGTVLDSTILVAFLVLKGLLGNGLFANGPQLYHLGVIKRSQLENNEKKRVKLLIGNT